MRAIASAPTAFAGSVSELFDRHVAAVAPAPGQVTTFHDLISTYIARPDAALVVRGDSALRRSEIRTRSGIRILPSDNSPAWWVHHVLWRGHGFDAATFASALASCPRHFHDVSRRRENGISAAGWYVAHILPAKFGNPDPETWSLEEAVMRFVRNVHPANHFYVPGGGAVGEDRRVIAYAARWASERYGPVWDEMVTWAGPQAQTYLDSLPSVTGHEPVAVPTSARSRPPLPMTDAGVNRLRGGTAEFRSTRLHFKAELIEPLGMDDAFRIVSPAGTFEMTKRQFYDVFSNVVASTSYRTGKREYYYPTAPAKADQFRVST